MGVHTEKKPKTKRGALTLRVLVLVVLLAVLVYLLYLISNAVPAGEEQPAETLPSVQTEAPAAETVGPTETPVPTEPPLPDFTPYHTDETDPALHVYNEAVSVDGKILGADETYHAAEEIDFGYGDDYTEMEGVITF
ncbi:MAG: hypothetical protein LUG87_04125, partial [Oscillospiraceae bacterium]|nr:hypothetical protein [Oscillospiraceae bacterium]